MYPVKQSTTLTIPVFAHDANGDAVTGMVDGGFTKRISKNGGAFAAMTVTITEMENGWYSIPLSASHTDTLGILSLTFTNASCKQINAQLRVSNKLIDDLNDIAATDIVSAGAITTLTGAVVNVDTVDTCTTNSDMRGTDNALLAASAPTNFGDLAITVTTGRVDINTNNDKTGYSISGTKQTLDALNDISAANVNAEVVDVIDTDTSGEPAQGAPPATTTLRTKLDYLFKAWRNRTTITATTISIYDDVGTTVDHKSTHSDDTTTYDRGEIVTGP